MQDIRELGLMTFSQASERWGKERSYVQQQYNKYPKKFLVGTVDLLKSEKKDRGTYVITRQGMEYLTSKTEEEANRALWIVIVQHGTNIIDEHACSSEREAEELMKKIAISKVQASSAAETIHWNYLDQQKKNYGVKIPGGLMVYYKKKT
ncbi:hypothetical protein IW492_03355 [Enterococcus sp. BWB1-3]|uniref:helix-turn-helix domain-containing protein n=1 Tax=unclassified Enterococcus TaxID=2608891 RepID=UPI0019211499|nr:MULTISPECIES: helix-turn-helix domain-containing protein [unclassified Enterococcus]MBL1228271.1 hypothetical protein [Enterococcus sp. BWB1-3]MCB5955054.1 hypothetical protein [Enterococcus sp. CWB-B31]